jgi:APA family basic amino acid/polyamine antiporter
MPTLARKLSLWNYFALGFGTMVGTGWVVMMDDWLGRGGSLGAMMGFAVGGFLLLPVSFIYGEWVKRLPDAAGEAAYTAQVFPPFVSYLTGWIMLLAYFIVCPWEAVALGKLAAYLFPRLDAMELYRVAGQPVFLPRLLLGLALTVFLAWLNYRGIRGSARLQNWTTTAVLGVFVFLVMARLWRQAGKSQTVFQPRTARLHPAHAADRAVLCYRLRICAQGCGRILPRISAGKFLQSYRHGAACGRGLLCFRDWLGVLHRAVGEFAGQALCHRDCF